jgi:Transcription factor Opi1
MRVYVLPSELLAICAMAPSFTPRVSVVRISFHIFRTIPPTHPALMCLAFQPTPALSIASSSNSPTLTSPTLAPEDPELDPEAADFVARVSTFPVVGSALRAYEQSKASSRVVKVPCDFSFSPPDIQKRDLWVI